MNDRATRFVYHELVDGPIGTVTFMNETQTVAIVWDDALAEVIRALPEICQFLGDQWQDSARLAKSWGEHAPTAAGGFADAADRAHALLVRIGVRE